VRARTSQTFNEFDGVNLDASTIKPNQARSLLNVVSREHGRLRRRDGSATFVSVSGAKSLGHVSAAPPSVGTGPDFAPMTITNTSARLNAYNDVTGSLWQSVTLPAGVTGGVFAMAEGPDFSPLGPDTHEGPLYMCDGVTAKSFAHGFGFQSWTAASGTLPLGKYLRYIGNRMLAAGMANNTSAVAASDIGNPRDWDTTDGGSWITKFDPFDGQDIQGIAVLGDQVLAFKDRKIFLIYDLDSGANRRISSVVGCAAPYSIAETPYGVMFLAHDGVWLTNGSSVERVSQPVDSLIREATVGQRASASGAWHNDRYYLGLTNLTSVAGGRATLEFDPARKTWWIHSLWGSQWLSLENANGVMSLYGVDAFGDIRKFFEPGLTVDSGLTPLNYAAQWTSAWQSFGEPALRKRCREIRTVGDGTYQILFATDRSATTRQVGSSTLAKGLNPGVGREMSVVLQGSVDFGIESYTALLDMRRD
jgi:hypothetical protein